MAADRVTHDLVTERIRSLGRHTLVIARRVAQGQRAYPGLEAKTATRAVNALRDAGLIEQHGWGDWQVTDPLLRRYLTEPKELNAILVRMREEVGARLTG